MSQPRRQLSIRCRAKINTVLRVLGKRPDGFHELDTEFVSLDLHDLLHLEAAEGFSLQVSGADPSEVPVEGNLVLRAAAALQDAVGRERIPGARFELVKRIPAAAGLGGGSSDAAGALEGLCRLYDFKPPEGLLERLALELGSDVPYFLQGGRQRGRGRGEELDALPERESRELVLLFPTAGLSTKSVFLAHADLVLEDQGGALTIRKTTPTFHDSWWKLSEFVLFNDLRSAALKVAPALAELESRLLIRFPAERIGMTGSGPTWFVLASESGAGDVAGWLDGSGFSEAFAGEFKVIPTRTVDRKEYRSTRFVRGPQEEAH